MDEPLGPEELEELEEPTRRECWLQAFYEYVGYLPEVGVVACPECGARTLSVLADGDPISRAGMCEFWCDTCLIGIQIFRMIVPDKIEIPTAAFDPRVAAMPRFAIVM